MKRLWDRMETWLKENAPEVLTDLHPGASESEISHLEEAVGFELPSELKESLRIHNGQSGDSQWLIAGWELLSTERILEEWQVWKDLYDSGSFEDWAIEAQDGVANVWWQPAWLPLTYDGSGNHHCIDLSPAHGGSRGQIITMWHDSGERDIAAINYTQWFEHLVSTFEKNDAEHVFDSGEFNFFAV
ncbi:SMI1/KNR4 family protein [Paenibacillus glycanilyticus]|uniref:SMI1/KNR4 family protein n=1 Tax=Paenibacillus glycanilyticus TaxID=126569 RepID=UPI002040DE2F|nr:SMI1/KNR4 family protein [Paenibacillus glycanilyticus]MCM3628428.1 SMI1/KNR4 family protein [Paenibacillus glycanilyticus]